MLERALLAALTAISLAGCTSLPTDPLPRFRLSPRSLGDTVSTAQHLEVTLTGAGASSGQIPALDTVLEVNPDRLRLAALAWGKRVLTLEWDGAQLYTQRHVPLPPQVDEQRILRDIQLAYWPLSALQAALPAGWSLQADAAQRQLLWQGQAMVTIHYQATPPWLGRTELHNQQEGYRLTLHTLSQEGSAP